LRIYQTENIERLPQIEQTIWSRLQGIVIPADLNPRQIPAFVKYMKYLEAGPIPTAMNDELDQLPHALLTAIARAKGCQLDMSLISPIMIKRMFFKGDFAMIPPDMDQRIKRYGSFRQSGCYDLIMTLYTGTPLADILGKEAHPLESIILLLNRVDPIQQLNALGIVHPQFVGHSSVVICGTLPIPPVKAKEYLLANITQYKHLLIRTCKYVPIAHALMRDQVWRRAYLQQLTDVEIITTTGFFPLYQSRPDLIQNVSQGYDTASFFIPTDPERRHSSNRTTISLNDVNTTTIPMIAYGTWSDYVTYEFEDLILAFAKDEDGYCSFRRPDNQHRSFDKANMTYLLRLLMQGPFSSPMVERLIEAINMVFTDGVELSENDKILLGIFRTLPDQQFVGKALEQLFYCGMYMRKWKGPGHAYPITDVASQKGVDPKLKVMAQIGVFWETTVPISAMGKKVLLTLPALDIQEHSYVRLGHPIQKYISEVAKEKYCIRQASTIFITTATHYLKLFLRQDTGINTNIDTIS